MPCPVALPCQILDLLLPTIENLIVTNRRRCVLPLCPCFRQFANHAIDLFDSAQLFAVTLNCRHYGQMVSVQRQEPAVCLEVYLLPVDRRIVV